MVNIIKKELKIAESIKINSLKKALKVSKRLTNSNLR